MSSQICEGCGLDTPFGAKVKGFFLCDSKCNKSDQSKMDALASIAQRRAAERKSRTAVPAIASQVAEPEEPAAPAHAFRPVQPPQPLNQARYFCNSCQNYTATAKMRGSGWIELGCYLIFFWPGILYSIWRRQGTPNVCPLCRQEGLVPAQAAVPGYATPPGYAQAPMGAVAPAAPVIRNEIECPSCAEPILAKAKVCKHCGNPVAIVSPGAA